MKSFVASMIALVVGFFTVTLAIVMGLFIGIVTLIARPFIKKKVAAAYAEAVKQQQLTEGFESDSSVIDGEYDDITVKEESQNQASMRPFNQLPQS